MYLIIFRVLGKFGGGNRKMMTEPQRLDYSIHRQSNKPAIIIKFNEHTEPVTFNVDMVCLSIIFIPYFSSFLLLFLCLNESTGS